MQNGVISCVTVSAAVGPLRTGVGLNSCCSLILTVCKHLQVNPKHAWLILQPQVLPLTQSPPLPGPCLLPAMPAVDWCSLPPLATAAYIQSRLLRQHRWQLQRHRHRCKGSLF
jgi:hypothetical protein